MLTESDDLAAALEIARQVWPQQADRPSALLLLLVDAGRRAILANRDEARMARLAVLDSMGVGLDGVYGPQYLTDLRQDWPE